MKDQRPSRIDRIPVTRAPPHRSYAMSNAAAKRRVAVARKRPERVSRQQPGGDTPGVAAASVALAGVIVAGVARFIVVPSAHADVFGVGTTVIVGSILVPPSSEVTG
jgi:hypothetical protein